MVSSRKSRNRQQNKARVQLSKEYGRAPSDYGSPPSKMPDYHEGDVEEFFGRMGGPPEERDMKYSGRGDGDAERLSLIRKELIKNKTLDKDGNFTRRTVGKAKGGSVRAFNNGGAVMSGRGPKFKGIT